MKEVSPNKQSSMLWHITTEAGMEVLRQTGQYIT